MVGADATLGVAIGTVWLVGVTAAMLLDPATRQRRAALLVVIVSVLTQVVYPWSATQLVTGDAVTVVVQGLRVAGILVATVLALAAIRPRRDTGAPSVDHVVG